MSNRVQTLPPTIGVKDPDVRSFLDALANAWDHRNGIIDKSSPDRFITAEEFNDLAGQAVIRTLGSALGGTTFGEGGGEGSVGDIIRALSDEIKKSLLYQMLGTPYANINLSELRQKINASVDQAAAFFAQEREARASADQALTSQITIQASQIGKNQAAIVAEAQTRVNKDNAIASAVNNIWAAIGGNSAVIQDGQLAQVNPSGAQATRWTQVQSEVIDPNTGASKVASIRQDFSAFSDKVNNKFGSLYTVRAQITAGGRTIVGGFGLSAIDGPGGPTIDFGVRADTFWVAGLDGAADIPFIIKNNKVYMKTALIEDLTVDTLKIRNQAMTDLWSTTVPADRSNTFTRAMKTFMSVSFRIPETGSGTANLMISLTANALATTGGAGGPACYIYVDGVQTDYVGISLPDGYSGIIPMTTSCTVAANASHTVEFRAMNTSEWNGFMGRGGMNVLVAKK